MSEAEFDKSYSDALVGLNPNSIANQKLNAFIENIPVEQRKAFFRAVGQTSPLLLEYYRNKGNEHDNL